MNRTLSHLLLPSPQAAVILFSRDTATFEPGVEAELGEGIDPILGHARNRAGKTFNPERMDKGLNNRWRTNDNSGWLDCGNDMVFYEDRIESFFEDVSCSKFPSLVPADIPVYRFDDPAKYRRCFGVPYAAKTGQVDS
jgi:hypothetical protein